MSKRTYRPIFADQMQEECKFFDTAVAIPFTLVASVEDQLALIPENASADARVGHDITIASIHIHGEITSPPDVVNDNICLAYLHLILDRQCNGAAATVTQVFTSTDLVSAMTNKFNEQRFIILKTFTFSLWAEKPIQAVDYYMPCNIPITYNGDFTDGRLATITSNNLFLLQGKSRDAGAPFFNGVVRVQFYDQ